MKVVEKNGYIEISPINDFLISQTFDCGQAFRFNVDERGDIEGIAYGKYIRLSQPKDDTLIIYNTTKDEFELIWKSYLALDCDYTEIKKNICLSLKDDKTISSAIDKGRGIRILRQEPWEALCSFIISQNNNIPRIKKIIDNMCRTYGQEIKCNDKSYYSFPTPEALYNAGIEGLSALRTGFRAKYIYDAAERIVKGELSLDEVLQADTEKAIKLLTSVKGVGIKVASCALLFGFGKTDVFPVDVWIKRVLDKYYPEGFDYKNLGQYAGIAQQYLFYYERYD